MPSRLFKWYQQAENLHLISEINADPEYVLMFSKIFRNRNRFPSSKIDEHQ